jgi:hypothetical protein
LLNNCAAYSDFEIEFDFETKVEYILHFVFL